MAIDLSYAPEVTVLVEKTRAFTREVVLPVEDEHGGDITAAGGDTLRVELQKAAKEAGVFAPHAPVEYGGHGLNMTDRAPVFEEAGYSLFGPIALNIGAPDEGNVHMLAHIASAEQKEQFLAPLAHGDVRSAFAMTEPSPGAGSDPSALTTRAEKVPGGWKINGHKYFITGADGAGFFIIFARTSGQPGDRGGATMFLTPADVPGLKVGRHIDTLDKSMIGGHCEVFFDDLFIPDSGVLGEVDEGFAYAQVRLGPARMTHVMRWLGAARRGHDVAVAHVARREGFGGKLGDLGMVQKMVADNEIDIAATRALLTQACWELDQGGHASNATSIAKTYAAEAIFRIVDRSIQMCGGLGVSGDLPLARLSREVRPFRVYDGPSEVHRWAIAKRVIGAAKKAAREAGA
ncbi:MULTISPECIES: acyl-CoA dehydrogenase family protein [Rhodococcus]|uniref:Acyl-CoA dehydrogenase family protein n=1 Tax=Rhodococcus oxybenzonivorans TaxID=1990687 RepID=A0AAE4UZH7_9NOCA|nr:MULTISPECIES: acyl-CoA dehydrogenase family protein [Rhodococcus]MDV7241320.1 acyl-CoA dehydrogenase family protein [Rhodococcus oxybenzonivorans]MDV7265980.1 acyl-CoA dehydrogenase family protein [Rhodococcus oxybenzonivorans]MDV7274147.1 acyl-CoA dehydrogenase family protein [Rhodococcus oxybenzonivorans]MDV7333600.1 acyl-CoA dehydrogenase family protein [Rhodococcus oxybenzonivorans]MDV7343020.1 acyl-CoA dehydrogenase family protein [Rhodococcus oxybenzonivorans]